MSWTVSPSLVQLRNQANALAPQRSTRVDGTIGDDRHAAQVSDHNPDAGGVVRALDLTHDPAGGLDVGAIADAIAASRDARVKYMIFNRRVLRSYAKPGLPAWTWAPYTGDGPHTDHLHVSVVADHRADSTRPWIITGKDDLTMITVTNPRTKKPWALPAALWSIWTYVLDVRDRLAIMAAKVDAIAARVDLSPTELAQIEQRARAAISAELDQREVEVK